MTTDIVQFVCFETSLPRPAFMAAWAPFASSFLARGIRRIVLAQRSAPTSAHASARTFGFISRNVWNESRFFETFPSGVPRDAGFGPIVAVQAGGFRLVRSDRTNPLDTRHDVAKVLALAHRDDRSADALAATLDALARQHPHALGASTYESVPRARGRFDAALEIYVSAEDAQAALDALTAGLAQALPGSTFSVSVFHEVETLSPDAH